MEALSTHLLQHSTCRSVLACSMRGTALTRREGMAFVSPALLTGGATRSGARTCARRPRTMCASRARNESEDEVKLELVEGHLENARVRPRLNIDAVDERMLMFRLRRMLHKDDFDRIFNKSDRRIGEW